MKGDMPKAALSLMAQLPCRTHTQPERPANAWTRIGDTARIRTRRGINGGANKRAVIINGDEFASVFEAAVAFGVHQKTMQRMLRDGRAKYKEQDK